MEKLGEKVYCSKCRQETNHGIIKEYKLKSGSYDDFQWIDEYYIVQCLGCDTVAFVRKYGDESMQYFNEDGEAFWYDDYTVYPEKPIENKTPTVHIQAKNFVNLTNHENLNLLYRQIVDAFNSSSFLLCSVGLRTLVEAICKNENVIGGMVTNEKGELVRSTKLVGKINGLVEKGLITQSQSEVLHQIRELGNYATHEIVQPKRKTLVDGIEVIEHILKQIYEFGQYKISPKSK
ncbi:DUF4145 domain-containing protein [Aneurinibacillus thermoaerophilus]|uniref:DUF4145 domain-containing protein n=1 Tax=Aneurinibacillus thermoaerophilus TaxID=143495 RepID=UPI002E20602F|nr:DUF4145 domain-containing protein [Aneurinibacillus thermoaerophilus]